MGALTQKVIGMKVLSKECCLCKTAQCAIKPVQQNDYLNNYNGSPKNIEVHTIYKLVIEAWDSWIYCLGKIVSDKYTTMKA